MHSLFLSNTAIFTVVEPISIPTEYVFIKAFRIFVRFILRQGDGSLSPFYSYGDGFLSPVRETENCPLVSVA